MMFINTDTDELKEYPGEYMAMLEDAVNIIARFVRIKAAQYGQSAQMFGRDESKELAIRGDAECLAEMQNCLHAHINIMAPHIAQGNFQVGALIAVLRSNAKSKGAALRLLELFEEKEKQRLRMIEEVRVILNKAEPNE